MELQTSFNDFVASLVQNENSESTQTEEFDQVTENAIHTQGLQFSCREQQSSIGRQT